MSTIQRLFRPLRQAAQIFFTRDLGLRRSEAGLEIVLQERRVGRQKPLTREELAKRKEREELEQMLQQLAAVLDELPETRRTLRHLVFVEQALQRKGWRSLHKLPLDLLQRALEQLEGLVVNWSPAGLANLRSKMAVAIIDREHMDPNAEADAYRTSMPMEASAQALAAAGEVPEVVELDAASAEAMALAEGDEAALAAAYAALGVAAGEPGPAAPRPAEIAAQTLQRSRSSAAAAMPTAGPDTLEYHTELGSQAAKAGPRQNLAGGGKLPALKLRELQD